MGRNYSASKHFNDRSRLWTSNYNKDENISVNFISRLEAVVNELSNINENRKIRTAVDLGCGTGPYLPYLSELAKEVIAIDIAPNMIAEAKSNLPKTYNNIKFINCSTESTPMENNSVDLTIAVGLLEYFTQPMVVLNEANRMLKSNGILIITLPNKYSIPNISGLPRTISLFLSPEIKIKIANLINRLGIRYVDISSFYLGETYTKNKIVQLVKKANFQPISIVSSGYYPFKAFGFDLPHRISIIIHNYLEKRKSLLFTKNIGNNFICVLRKGKS